MIIAYTTTLKRRRGLRALVTTASFLIGAAMTLGPTRAESEEKAVAYFMFGLEEGEGTTRVATNKWTVEGRDGAMSTYEVKRVTKCQFSVHVQRQVANTDNILRFDYLLDFASVTEYDAWVANSSGVAIIIKIDGISWYSKKLHLKNGQVLQEIGGGSIDANVAIGGSAARLRSAYADFRGRFCPGQGS